jgi:hypothetical protein
MDKTTDKIYSALAKFADIVKPIEKDASNPFFKSKYATLSHIQEVIKPHLKASGLILVHAVTGDSVTSTVYAVEDGSSVSSAFPFILGKPQENGSAVTYAKRYNTAALLNLDTDADDDGNEAQKNETVHATKPAYKPDLAKAEYTGTHVCKKCAKDVVGPDIRDGQYGKYFICPHCTKISNANPKKDLSKEAGSIFKDPKAKAGEHVVDGIAIADIPF